MVMSEGRIFCVKDDSAAAFLSTQFLYIVHMLVPQRLRTGREKRQERIALKPCYISFHIAFMFDSLRKNLLHFRWISICFMIAKNACLCYICILCFMHIRLAFSATLSIVRFYCIHDSILFHLKMHFNGLSQSASFSRAGNVKKEIEFFLFINKK
jgi:hypothetical protein